MTLCIGISKNPSRGMKCRIQLNLRLVLLLWIFSPFVLLSICFNNSCLFFQTIPQIIIISFSQHRLPHLPNKYTTSFRAFIWNKMVATRNSSLNLSIFKQNQKKSIVKRHTHFSYLISSNDLVNSSHLVLWPHFH